MKQGNNIGKIIQQLADGLAKKRGFKSANEIPCEKPGQCQFPKLCRKCTMKAEFFSEARRRVNLDIEKKGVRQRE